MLLKLPLNTTGSWGTRLNLWWESESDQESEASECVSEASE